jgi:O-antigen ligase
MNLRRLCRLAVQCEPLLLLLLIPAVPVPQKLLYLGLVIPPAIWVCARLSGANFIQRTALDWAFVLFLAMVGLSQVIGMDAQYSLPKITFLVWGVVAFYVTARFIRNADRLRQATVAFLVLGLWYVAIGFFGSVTPPVKSQFLAAIADWIPDLMTQTWGYSTDPNNISAGLAFFAPLQATLLLAWLGGPGGVSRARRRYWLGIFVQASGLLLTVGALLLNQSRATLLGLLAAAASLAAWRLARSHRSLALALVIGCTAIVLVGPQALAAWLVRQGGDSSAVDSLIWRQEVWVDSLRAIRDFPLTGLGMVRVRDALPTLYPAASLSPVTLMMKDTYGHFVEVALSFGLPALVAFLALWLGTAWSLISAGRSTSSPWVRAVVEGLAAGLLANFVYGITGSIVSNAKVGLAFWLALGLAAGAYRIAHTAAGTVIHEEEA